MGDSSDKRQQLISSAFELFYTKGVHAVGINEVLSHSGVAKKTLYNHFKSKHDLVLAVLQYRDQRFCDWFAAAFDAAEPGQSRVLAMFDALDDWFNDRVRTLAPFHGCFFINVSGEFSEPDDPLHRQCAHHKARVAGLIQAQVQALELNESDSAMLTRSLCLLKEGAITLAYVQGDRAAAVAARRTAEALIRSLSEG